MSWLVAITRTQCSKSNTALLNCCAYHLPLNMPSLFNPSNLTLKQLLSTAKKAKCTTRTLPLVV